VGDDEEPTKKRLCKYWQIRVRMGPMRRELTPKTPSGNVLTFGRSRGPTGWGEKNNEQLIMSRGIRVKDQIGSSVYDGIMT